MKLPRRPASYGNLKQLLEPYYSGTKKLIRTLKREFYEGGLKHRAMSLVYTSLLSLAPLLAVSFSVLKAFGVHNQAEPLLLELLAPLGAQARDMTTNIITFVENIRVGVLGFIGFVALFYTVVSLLEQIEDSLNHVWRVVRARSFLRRFSDFLSMILIGPVLVFSGLGIAATMTSTALAQRIIAIEPFGTAYYLTGILLPYVLIIAAFTFAYLFIPNTSVKPLPALTGGTVAGIAWKATGSLFAVFAANSAQYNAIYSGFAVILLFIIWLYLSWLILLLGGVIAFHCQYPRYLNYVSRQPRLSGRCKEQLGLVLMYLIGRSHFRGESAWTLHGLADAVNLPWESVAESLDCLRQSHLVLALDDEDESYIPARDTDAILLREIVQAVRSAGDQPTLSLPEHDLPQLELQRWSSALDQGIAQLFADRTLRDVIAS